MTENPGTIHEPLVDAASSLLIEAVDITAASERATMLDSFE